VDGIHHTESVIVNGGKCLETATFLKQHPEFVSLTESDEGISDAFNKGINLSTGDFITFLNSGDKLIDRAYYDFANNYFTQNPNVDFIYADIIFNHRDHGELLVKPNTFIGKTPFPHPSLIVRKRVFDKIGGFDKKLKVAMDFDFMCNMIKNKFTGYYYSNTPVVYMDGNGASSSNGLKGINERLLVLKRYGLLDFHSAAYLRKLKLKTEARNILQRLNLLEAYDKIKKSLIKPKSE
jgi:hypothetical protein